MSWIADRFGSRRGLVRLALSHLEVLAGNAAPRRTREPVGRLVFVCHGNICRSAYAEAVAHRLGVPAASFGLSTTTGKSANAQATAAAARRGVDLSMHVTTDVDDFIARPGDLLLAMEPRHMRKLAADPRMAAVPRDLLGRFAGFPHLHDPYELSDAYFDTVFARIDRAVAKAARLIASAR